MSYRWDTQFFQVWVRIKTRLPSSQAAGAQSKTTFRKPPLHTPNSVCKSPAHGQVQQAPRRYSSKIYPQISL